MTKTNGVAARTPSKHASAKKQPAAAAVPAAEDDAVPRATAASGKKKKKHSIAPAVAADAEEEITLFHPATAVAPAAVPDSGDAAMAEAAEGQDDAAEEDFTSQSFLDSLTERQAPELLQLLQDLNSKVKDLRRNSLKPLLSQARARAMPTEEGMSFLELKTHLMLQYLQHLLMFVLCKLSPVASSASAAEAAATRQQAVVRQLVYLRAVLEKLRPLDKKLRYQVDKMAKLAQHINMRTVEAAERGEDEAAARTAAEAESSADIAALLDDDSADPLSFRPNPAALMASTEDAAKATAEAGARSGHSAAAAAGSGLESGNTGIYRPPRITSTQLDDAEKAASRRARDLARAQQRAKGNAYLQHLRGELSQRPEEMSLDIDAHMHGGSGGGDSSSRARLRAEEAEREAYEESNLLRLSDTRADKARKREVRKARLGSGLAELAHDMDDFRDVERQLRERDDDDDPFLSLERREQLQRDAQPRKRKGRGDDEGFDDPLESRHAKKRRGPNGKNSYGAQFKGGKGGKGKGRGGKR